jgi:hypothetical protein
MIDADVPDFRSPASGRTVQAVATQRFRPDQD